MSTHAEKKGQEACADERKKPIILSKNRIKFFNDYSISEHIPQASCPC